MVKRWFSMRPVGRGPYLFLGLFFFILKIAADYAVAGAFGKSYSVLFYVSPMDAPLFHPGEQLDYWLACWGVSIPFISFGVWLTLRRLRDAALPLGLVLCFFIPFANLIFFLTCALVPHRDAATRASKPPSVSATSKSLRTSATSIPMAGALGAIVALGALGVSVGLFGDYGASLFLGAPACSGFVAALSHAKLGRHSLSNTFSATVVAFLISFAVMFFFALEGAICLLMAAPLAFLTAIVGALFGHLVGQLTHDDPSPLKPVAFGIVIPVLCVADVISPIPLQHYMAESVIDVDAPPEVVWDRVVAMPRLPEPEEALFRIGVAAPLGAVIDGEGVGAIRRCQFTTGEFIEPITVWDPPHDLGFSVQSQPHPMIEFSPWDIEPPHLDGYFRTTRGQFHLERLPNNRTRVTGRTFFEVDIAPQAYWSIWAESMIHQIHLRVLRHVRDVSERDYRARFAQL